MSLYRCLSCVIRRGGGERIFIPIIPLVSKTNKSIDESSSDAFLDNKLKLHYVNVRNYAKSSSSSSSSSDSDSGKGAKNKLKGQTAFWRQKMRTHHMAIDLNNDGVVSWDDFEELIKNFGSLGNLPAEDLAKLTEALKHVWEEEWGASNDPYAFIGFEQFLKNMEHVVNTKILRKKVAKPLPYFFNAVDWDSSGEISVEEFKTFFKCLKLPEESAIEAFKAIDVNGDGTLSKKEFVEFGRDFFLSEDESGPSKLFWGPLAN